MKNNKKENIKTFFQLPLIKKDMIVDMIRHIIQRRNKHISTHLYSLPEYRWLKKMRTPLMENIKSEAISL